MRKITTIGFLGAAAAVLGTTAVAVAGSPYQTGPMRFDPIAGSAAQEDWASESGEPWLVPDGYSQHLVSGELSDMCGGPGLNIYGGGADDWNDMNTVNETGRQAGRYLYRTHEVRGNPTGGAVSVVDLQTCETNIIDQDTEYDALDGIVWTPWGTILFAEEIDGGSLFEIVLDEKDPMNGTVYERPAVGHMAHEGIELGPDGSIYVVDEYRGQSQGGGAGGGIYKFVPDTYGDLSSGTLSQLAVDDGSPGSAGENVGQGSWVEVDASDVRASGLAVDGAAYERPEDLERIGDVLYAAITEGTKVGSTENYDGRVLAIDLESLEVSDYVKPGMNAPIESNGATGFDNPDNLAHGPDGKLWIVEDNVPSDIWVAVGSDKMQADSIGHFASLKDYGAEGTGIYFGKDPKTLFVNIQHSQNVDGDGTWAITSR